MAKKIRVIKAKKEGQKDIHFKPGALHSQLGVPQGEKIPAKKMRKAKSGALGQLAEKRANFAANVLTGGK